MAETEPPSEPSLLEAVDVSHSYGDAPILHSVGFQVRPGRCVALTGDNGSGKSTLLRLAAGREHPTSGAILFRGSRMNGDRASTRAAIASVMDAGVFYPDLTMREHLMLVALAHGLAGEADEAVDEAMAVHRIADKADLPGTALSSGQRQQMLLAAASVRPCELLILDEPEQRLDTGAREELSERLTRFKESGKAILLATHWSRLVEDVADDEVHLVDGVVMDVEDGRDRDFVR